MCVCVRERVYFTLTLRFTAKNPQKSKVQLDFWLLTFFTTVTAGLTKTKISKVKGPKFPKVKRISQEFLKRQRFNRWTQCRNNLTVLHSKFRFFWTYVYMYMKLHTCPFQAQYHYRGWIRASNCMCVCVYIHTYIYTRTCIYKYIHSCMHICICVCVYKHMCVHI